MGRRRPDLARGELLVPSDVHAARIIDASANRAREALRMLEDVARFALDDQPLTSGLKSLRHDLREVIASAGIDAGLLLASRDTPGDVGASVTTPAEMDRPGLPAVAAAAARRLTEALRSIEECLKIDTGAGVPRRSASEIESLRYRAYDLEKRLVLALGTGTAPQWRLCVLVTEALCTHHSWQVVCEQAIEGGADCVQLREKALPDGELLRRASRLVEIARAARNAGRGGRRVMVVINDRPDIALASGADGVHLGQDDLPVLAARRLAGFSMLIGVSTSNIQQARAAIADGADYCGVGPMFPTSTKDKPVLAGPAYLAEYLATPVLRERPHLAIGGVTPENVPQLVRVGCRGVAVSSAVCKVQRPAVACRALHDGFAPTH